MNDLVGLFRSAVGEFDRRVAAVGAGQWDGATPCTEWSVRDLINHLVVEDLWAPELLAGATLEDVGDRFDGDQLGSNAAAAWAAARDGALAAVDDGALARSVHTSRGEIPAAQYVAELFADHLVHGWDLARGTGGDEALPLALVEPCLEMFAPHEQELKDSGYFGERITPGPDADPQERLLALFGRRSRGVRSAG